MADIGAGRVAQSEHLAEIFIEKTNLTLFAFIKIQKESVCCGTHDCSETIYKMLSKFIKACAKYEVISFGLI